MKRAIRKSFKDFAAVIGLMVIAAVVGGYILSQQRLRFPLVEDAPFTLKAEFSTAQAVTPGQGQTVRVSGVRIGDIGKVELRDGVAVVSMDIDQQYREVVHTDAKALLRPKTGLKDMFIELDPGSRSAPVAREGWTMPVANTLPDVNPDEIFAALDADTRDYLTLLVDGAGKGLADRGDDLREVFRRFEPTHRDLAKVTGLVAQRDEHLRRLVNRLARLNGALADKDDELTRLVSSSASVLRAFSSEQAGITQAVGRLPGTLRQTTATLGKVQRLADTLGPATNALRPAVRRLDDANRAVTPFVTEAAPLLRTRVRPFVRAARPTVADLAVPARRLAETTPDLTRAFTALNALLNLAAYNQNGKEGPGVKDRDEGYLFWAAWLQHVGNALFSTGDANGPFRPVSVGGSCGTISQVANSTPLLGMVLAPVLADPTVCKGVLG
ncbi:MCE family protein [Conexibacter sp. W3-3-2]|uniref:MlaD family protein n=1 Tax=Conexibacter sp. W3-3-2 TaxID=2675227 RepID=UPI0012B7ECE0|nr:MlaD family protein [Conexibacter sp. W3-3-2]MTD46597.1 MCE family protein [Conexibacter sp. W3-3-2]